MARTLEELIILKRSALKYLIARESKLLSLGKNPVNKKIANFVRKHEGNSVWTDFCDSLNEDLTRNLNVFEWRADHQVARDIRRTFRLNSASRDLLLNHKFMYCGGRMTEAPVVKVEQGRLQGKVVESPSGKSFFSFQGIPYAKPPIGSLRFKAPQPAEPWDDIRDATAEGNASAQIEPFIHKQYIGDENCLFLNVYTPNLDGEFLPVMVFLHGGKFKYGSGSSEMYGPDFLVEKDIILVTINYRLGALGFLGLNTPEVPGNAGLKDIALALRWVKENIHNFGGNSGNITLCGYSAGGVATSILTASPLTKDLINKAILQSGTAVSSLLLQKNPVENAKSLAKALGCESTDVDEILEFLSTTPVKDLVEATEKLEVGGIINKNVLGLIFGPIVEKEFPGVESVLTESFTDLLTSGRVAKIPIMIGTDTLEFTFERFTDDLQAFIPEDLNIAVNTDLSVGIADKMKFLYFEGSHTGVESLQEYFDLLSDVLINVDIHRHVKYLVKETTKPIYYYKFDFVGELNLTKNTLSALGLDRPGHSDELGYLFKNVQQDNVEPTPQDVKTRERMLRLWTNFAKSGNPTPDENHYLTVTWLPVTKDNLYYLRIGNELSIGSNPEAEKMEFWEELYSKHYKTWEQPWTRPEPVKEIAAQTAVVEDNVATEETANNSEETAANLEEPIASEEVQENVNSVDGVVETTDVTENQIEHKVEDPVLIVEEKEVIVEDKIEEPVLIIEDKIEEPVLIIEDKIEEPVEIVKETNGVILKEDAVEEAKVEMNGNGVAKPRTSNEIKMVQNGNGQPKDVIRASDPPEDDLPKNIGVRSKFVNFFESLGGKK